jgi:hypothetical protein
MARIKNYDEFLNEAARGLLTASTKKELTRWADSPRATKISDEASAELRSNPALRPGGAVTLYRGMLFRGDGAEVTSEMFDFSSKTPTSWTTNVNVARRFGRFNRVSTGNFFVDSVFADMRRGQIDEDLGVVIKKTFSPDEILVDMSRVPNKMSTKYQPEDEVIVEPFDGKCEIVTVFTKKQEYSPKEYLARSKDNGYEKALSEVASLDLGALREKVESLRKALDDDMVGASKSLDKKDAYELYDQFSKLRKKMPAVEMPVGGSSKEDQETYDRIEQVKKYLEHFDSSASRSMRPQYTAYYYQGVLIGRLKGKDADRMTSENRRKMAEKIQAETGVDFEDYGFWSNFSGNWLYRMSEILANLDLLKKVK